MTTSTIGQAEETPREPLMPFVGHAPIVNYFERIGPERLSHAYLMHGPRGVGKRTFARTLAMRLHCERPTSFPLGYCGVCGSCRRGLAGSSGDTIYVDAGFIRLADELAGNDARKTDALGIEAARLVVHRMQLRSYEGGRMVCIFPNFENVPYGRDEVYNALLKELEEPDPGKVFLLTTDQPERILPTIRSRATSIRFGGLKEDEIARALVERYGEPPSRAESLARRAQGSLGDAIAMRDDDGAALVESARQWVFSCLRRPRSLPPMPVLDSDDPRSSLALVLGHARTALRDCMVYAVSGADAVFDKTAVDQYRAACDALGARAASRAANALALISEAENLAVTNISPIAVLGWLQVQLRASAGA